MPVAVEFGIALVVIVAAATLFTNAVEILGGRLNLGQGAVGSVMAAVGTALPETMIPIVAILAAALSGEGGRGCGGDRDRGHPRCAIPALDAGDVRRRGLGTGLPRA